MEPVTVTLGALIAFAALAFGAEYLDSALGMGYGTILTPILLLTGYEPLVVVPSVLLSQAASGLAAAAMHNRLRNIDLEHDGEDRKLVLIITALGIGAVIVAVLIAVELPKLVLSTYIAVLVLVMGALLLSAQRFVFSWRRMYGISLLSSFNKALSGGGFGPVVTSGQIIAGRTTRSAVGITTAAEAPICITSFCVYTLVNGWIEPLLPAVLTLGALAATPLGPLRTGRVDEYTARRLVGVLTLTLGVFILVRTYIWV